MMMGGWCWMGLLTLASMAGAQEPPRGVELGLGVRDAMAEAGRIEGATLIGRYRAGPLSLEGDLYGAWSTARYSGLDFVLASLISDAGYGDIGLPISTDRVAASVLAGLHPWALGGRGAAPVLYLGAEARYQDRYTTRYQPEDNTIRLDADGHRVLVGPLLGAGIEAELGPAGVRLAAHSRPHLDLSASAWEHDVSIHLDAFLRLHAWGAR